MNHICRFQQIASGADGDDYVSLIPIKIMMLLTEWVCHQRHVILLMHFLLLQIKT